MAGLKTLFGLYPQTSEYENNRKKLEEEFNSFIEFETSEELTRFRELEKYVSSDEFSKQQKELLGLRYKGSEEHRFEVEHKQLSKDKSIKLYLKTSSSSKLQDYNKLKDSKDLTTYLELLKFVGSAEFIKVKTETDKKEFTATQEFQKQQELDLLKKDSRIKAFTSFDKSKELANYNTVKDSDKLKRYYELGEYIKSEAFIEKKKYLSMSPKTRWKQSDPFAILQEFQQLKNSAKIKWYLKVKSDKSFDFVRNWQVTFEDDFNSGKLDTSKWITRYFWGEELLKESYSLLNDKHFVTDGKNIDFGASTLKIVTRSEQTQGKVWDPEVGFRPIEFNYTSGLINSGKSYRQKFGYIEAKIRFSSNPKLQNAFWMVGDEMLPHIDVANIQTMCSFGVINSNGSSFVKSIKKKKLTTDFFIYSIEWTPDKIVWRVNGLEKAVALSNIPQDEMYLAFSSGLYEDATGLPSAMEIDWVRCYQKR